MQRREDLSTCSTPAQHNTHPSPLAAHSCGISKIKVYVISLNIPGMWYMKFKLSCFYTRFCLLGLFLFIFCVLF